MIDIFIPSLHRPHRISDIISNIRTQTSVKHKIYFIFEKDDFTSIQLAENQKCEVVINEGSPSYAGAINTAFKKSKGECFFMGADDLLFHEDWDIPARKLLDYYGVVGTNDLYNPNVLDGRTSTHSLVSRKYINEYGGTADNSFPVLFEYKHNYCDTEFIDTAKKRGQFKPCLESVVEHLHWSRGMSGKDATYDKGDMTAGEDHQTFTKRSHLWL